MPAGSTDEPRLLVGIEGGVVSEVINLESSGVGALNRMIGFSASERAFHVSQLLFTLRHTRPTVSLRILPSGSCLNRLIASLTAADTILKYHVHFTVLRTEMGTSKSPRERSRLRGHRATSEEHSGCVERTWGGRSLIFQDLQGFLIAFDGPGRAIPCGIGHGYARRASTPSSRGSADE